MSEPIWTPSAERVAACNLTRFAAYVRERHGAPAGGYDALWRWSVEQREQFWAAVMEFAQVLDQRLDVAHLLLLFASARGGAGGE